MSNTSSMPQSGPRRHHLDPLTRADLLDVLAGYENLLRWGHLSEEQLTIALYGQGLADGDTDLLLADRVRCLRTDLGDQSHRPLADR